MDWEIQKAQAGDAAVIAGFQIEMALESEGLALDRKTVESGVKAVLEDSSKGLYFVARGESGTVAGSLFLTKEWSDWHNKDNRSAQKCYRSLGMDECHYLMYEEKL